MSPAVHICGDLNATRRAEGAAAKTINHDLALLGHAIQLAVKEWEWVAENPVHKGLEGKSA